MSDNNRNLVGWVERSETHAGEAGPTAWVSKTRPTLRAVLALVAVLALASVAQAQRTVTFPPAEAPPPPPAKAPPKTQAGGEETDIIPDTGPSMRKTQHRTPPPPTNLCVIHKVEYGDTLQYKHADGTVQKFEQWKSYPNDAVNLVTLTKER